MSAILPHAVSNSDSSPSAPPDGEGDVPHTRRQSGGARREASERVTIRAAGFETTGWTLNVSRGGMRLVLEDPATAESEYEIEMSDGNVRRGRIVWTRDEADGQIAGLQFLDGEGTVPPPPADSPSSPKLPKP